MELCICQAKKRVFPAVAGGRREERERRSGWWAVAMLMAGIEM